MCFQIINLLAAIDNCRQNNVKGMAIHRQDW